MSSRQYRVPISLAIIVIIFHRNPFPLLRFWMNFNSASYLQYPDFPGFSLDSDPLLPHIQTMTSEDSNIPSSVYFAKDDDTSDSGSGQSSEVAPQQQEMEQPRDQNPEMQPYEPPYDDDFDRASRSHYAGAGGYGGAAFGRRSGCDNTKLSYSIMIWILFLVYL